MSFFDSIKASVLKAVEEQSRHSNNFVDTNRASALKPGRMKETDKIKGKESPLPNKAGVYYHKNKETGENVYVGQANDIRKRQQEHARSGKLDITTTKVVYAEAKANATKDDLCNTEKAKIIKHQPSGNTTEGGNGRR
jgi:hypothetical protein